MKAFKHTFKYSDGEGGTEELVLTTSKMPAKQGLDLMIKLPQMFSQVGASLAALFLTEDRSVETVAEDTAPSEVLSDDFDLGQKGRELMMLANSIRDIHRGELHALIVELCESCYAPEETQSKVTFSQIFDTRPPTLIFQVAVWVLKVNFSDFFVGTGMGQKLSQLINK